MKGRNATEEIDNHKKLFKTFVNHLMLDGKKNTAYGVFYSALGVVENKMKGEEKAALDIWKQALDNITPLVEVKSKRIGGATFQVPTEIRADRKESIAMKNMIAFARKRGSAVVTRWLRSWLQRSWMHTTTKVVRLSVKRICTVWLRLTVHSHTSDFN